MFLPFPQIFYLLVVRLFNKFVLEKITVINNDIESTESDLEDVTRIILEQEELKSQESPECNERVLQENKKSLILNTGDLKKLRREKKLLEKQLKDFKDGFEHHPERQENRENVEEFSANAFYEITRVSESMGDTTTKLRKSLSKYQSKKEKLEKVLEKAIRNVSGASGRKLEQLQAVINDTPSKVATLEQLIKETEERIEYYIDTKETYKEMLRDGKITKDEYKLYKKSLKHELS